MEDGTYMGKPVAEMTREELIELVHYLVGALEEAHAVTKRVLDVWELARNTRR